MSRGPVMRAAIDRILGERSGHRCRAGVPVAQRSFQARLKGLGVGLAPASRTAAELPKLKGGVWHPYRRKWATVRKHLSLADVAAAGGWSPESPCSVATS